MFVINIASPIYEQAEAWHVYSRITFTENMKNKPKAISMQRAALSQSLMSVTRRLENICHGQMLLMENPEAFYALVHPSLWL